MAADWAGYGGDWLGYTTDWGNTGNWSGGENEFLTAKWSIDPGDAAGGNMPTISAGNDTVGGWARIRNGSVITQTGGSHQWLNGTGGNNTSMYIYNGGQWNISGGSLQIDGVLNLGYNQYVSSPSSNGTEAVNISGTGVVSVLYNLGDSSNPYDININPSVVGITIADDGKLVVESSLEMVVNDLIVDGLITGIGGTLGGETVGDTYVVSIVPEPATMALLGLGALVLRRKK
jgi:hypothetical protein